MKISLSLVSFCLLPGCLEVAASFKDRSVEVSMPKTNNVDGSKIHFAFFDVSKDLDETSGEVLFTRLNVTLSNNPNFCQTRESTNEIEFVKNVPGDVDFTSGETIEIEGVFAYLTEITNDDIFVLEALNYGDLRGGLDFQGTFELEELSQDNLKGHLSTTLLADMSGTNPFDIDVVNDDLDNNNATAIEVPLEAQIFQASPCDL